MPYTAAVLPELRCSEIGLAEISGLRQTRPHVGEKMHCLSPRAAISLPELCPQPKNGKQLLSSQGKEHRGALHHPQLGSLQQCLSGQGERSTTAPKAVHQGLGAIFFPWRKTWDAFHYIRLRDVTGPVQRAKIYGIWWERFGIKSLPCAGKWLRGDGMIASCLPVTQKAPKSITNGLRGLYCPSASGPRVSERKGRREGREPLSIALFHVGSSH